MLKKSWLLGIIALLAAAMVACQPATPEPTEVPDPTEEPTEEPMEEPTEEPMEEMDPTIAEIATDAGNFNTLLAALEAADLTGTFADAEAGPFTVFAPTDEAFAAALDELGLTADELLADTDTLTTILQYHVVEGAVTSDQVVELDGESVATLSGEEINVSVEDGTVILNENVTVVDTDLQAANGVVHVIDSVLIPPSVAGADQQSIAEIAAANGDFSTLVAALDAAGLTDTFAGEGTFTVFAPTNAAFEAALAELGITAEELLADTETLTAILQYHVADEVFTAEDITSGGPLFYTLEGSPIQANVIDGNVVINGEATVVQPDLEATNGVIHVIDSVLLPPAYETEAEQNIAEVATEQGSFETLLAAAEAAGLVPALTGEGPFTVFAPTDAAFEAALADLGLTADELLADTDTLTNILLYHIALGAFDSAAVTETESYTMLNGQELAVADIPLTDTLDVEASNGIIHVIDGVLLPPEAEAAEETETIADIVAGNDDFSTLAAALEQEGLVETFADPEAEFTVFAPNNAAFEAALAELGITADELLAREDLAQILQYHVVEGAVTSDEVVELDSATTLLGEDITIEVVDGGVVLNGSVNVVQTDIQAANGVIHVIDFVLLPPSE
jgi:transforming growth factor-beta-induced protein